MAEKKRGLGRGLGALISSSPAVAAEENDSVSRETTTHETIVADNAKSKSGRPVDMFFEPGRKTNTGDAGVPGTKKPIKRGRATMPDLTSSVKPRSTSEDASKPSKPEPQLSEPTIEADSEQLVEVPGARFAEVDVKDIHPNR